MHSLSFQRVKVANIAHASEDEIETIFSQYGEVLDVYKPRNLVTNDYHGHAIVTYGRLDEAAAAQAHPGTSYYVINL